MTLTQKNGSKIKTPSSKSLILVSFCWKKNVLLITVLTNLIKSLISLKLVIESVAFFLGHPVYCQSNELYVLEHFRATDKSHLQYSVCQMHFTIMFEGSLFRC